jgi:hypothetical protein
MTKKSTTAKRLDPEVWDRIDKWRKKGKSYKELSMKFKISKGTLSYRYGQNQKEKTLARQQKRRDCFQHKVDSFLHQTHDVKRNPKFMNKRPERTWDYKIRGFHKDKNNSTKGLDMPTAREQMMQHLWPNDGKDEKGYSFPWIACKITGKKVSVMVPKGHYYACNLDHVLPVARGGANELENCQPLTDKINYAKGDMTNEEFFDMITTVTQGDMYKKYMKGKK